MIAIRYLARGVVSALVLAALLAGAATHAQTTGEALRIDRGSVRKVPLPDEEQPYNDASLQGQTVPSAMTAGAVYSVSVSMNNIGTTTWTSGASYALGAQNPPDNVTWGGGRAALGATVAPGQTAMFAFQVTAPSTPGTYDFQWKMVQDGVEWFGGVTPNVAVTVTAPAAAPTISVSRAPATMVAGRAFTLTWSTTNATALSRSCSAGGSGYATSDAPPTSGSSSGIASTEWIGYPSTCVWSASGPEGTATYTETMTTVGGVTSGDTVTYIHTDGLGSPVARSDTNGNEISRTGYEPYGATAAGVTPTIGFTGHMNDADSGLAYMQQRYYDPVAGRFLSVDPVVTDAETGGGFNRYAYAANNPYKYFDPDGRQTEGIDNHYCETYGCGSSSVGMNTSAKVGAVFGGVAGVAVAAGCDIYTLGTCAVANPGLVVAGAAGGALVGASAGAMLSSGSTILAKNIAAATAAVKRQFEASHHIVAEKDPRAAASRAILAGVKMDINSAFNGMTISSMYHSRLHTNVYHATVQAALSGVSSYTEVAATLTGIRFQINMGMFPF
jgi:RHS repeat-associated protein